MNDEFGSIREVAGWLAAAAVGTWIGIKKILSMNAREDARIEHARADEALVKGLRLELGRLGKQNGELAEALNKLQIRIHDLQVEVGQLRGENVQQTREICDLHAENGRLREDIATLHAEIIILRNGAAK